MKRDWLKELRLEKGLSQRQLGKNIGVTDVAVKDWEKGFKTPRIVLGKKLAQELGFDWTRLYEDEEE